MKKKVFAYSTVAVLAAGHGSLHADHPSIAYGAGGVGPINVVGARSMPKGLLAVGLHSEVINNKAFSDADLAGFAAQGVDGVHSVDEVRTVALSLGYGLGERFGLSLRVPYVVRENVREIEHHHEHAGDADADHLDADATEASVQAHGDSAGLGDAVLLGQYQLPLFDSTDLGLLFGVKAPTGETRVKANDGVRFETDLQPGTGSWDLLVGSALSQRVGHWGYHAAVVYNPTTEGSQSTELGDLLAYGAGVTYSTEHHGQGAGPAHQHAHGGSWQWHFLLEVHGETRGKSRIAGDTEPNTGGKLVYVSPGIRAMLGRFSGSLSVSLPVLEDLNGRQTDVDTRIVAAISVPL